MVTVDPFEDGHRKRERIDSDGTVTVPYTGDTFPVARLLDTEG